MKSGEFWTLFGGLAATIVTAITGVLLAWIKSNAVAKDAKEAKEIGVENRVQLREVCNHTRNIGTVKDRVEYLTKMLALAKDEELIEAQRVQQAALVRPPLAPPGR